MLLRKLDLGLSSWLRIANHSEVVQKLLLVKHTAVVMQGKPKHKKATLIDAMQTPPSIYILMDFSYLDRHRAPRRIL